MIDDIISSYKMPSEIQRSLSEAFRSVRKSRRHGRKETSIRTGVPEATIRRFEDTGEISLRQLLMLCDVYGNASATDSLFPLEPQSMDELIAMSNRK